MISFLDFIGCLESTLDLRLNLDHSLQGLFDGGAPNIIFSIPKARTQNI